MPDEEKSPMQKATGACGLCILGFLIFPLTLWLLGMNEKKFVCEQKNILLAEQDAAVTECDANPGADKFISLSCPLDKEAFKTFTMSDFIMDSIEPKFKDKISFKSLSGKMSAPEMFQCVEASHEVTDVPGCQAQAKTKEKDAVVCKTHPVYSYSKKWQASSAPNFKNNNDKKSWPNWINLKDGLKSCGGLKGAKNPPYPAGADYHGDQQQPPPTKVKLEGNFYLMPFIFAGGKYSFKPEGQVPLGEFASNFANNKDQKKEGEQHKFNAESVVVQGNFLQTCKTDVIGCTRVSFFKNTDTGASALLNSGKLSEDGKTYETKSNDYAASWGCSKGSWFFFQKGTIAKDEIIKKINDANEMTLYVYRVIGVLACWAAVYCCLYPIVAFFDIMEDYLARIPCIGPCLSVIGTIVEWLVTIVVCCMSCSFGCSAALFTIAIVWLVMRPMQSLPMIAACVVMVGCAVALSHLAPKKEKAGQARDLSVELADGGDA